MSWMMQDQYLDVHGLTVLFRSSVPDHYERLREDYGPFFRPTTVSPNVYFVVGADRDNRLEVSLAAETFSSALGDTVVADPGRGVQVFGSQVAHARAYASEVRAHFTAQVLSELTRRRELNLFHASAVAGSRGAVLFAGAKKAGKSTFAMLCSLAGAQYMSNDMTLLSLSESEGPVTVMGLPQPITLAPGALDWFARRRPEAGVADSDGVLDPALEASNRYALELGDKSRIGVGGLGVHTRLCSTARPLSAIVFPEADMDLPEPRIRQLGRDEAVARLSMLAETFLKWRWPVPLPAEDLLRRSHSLILAAADNASCYHLQWSADHDLNYGAIEHLL